MTPSIHPSRHTPRLCREETHTIHYPIYLHSITTTQLYFPNHDVFFLASFLAFCYYLSSAFHTFNHSNPTRSSSIKHNETQNPDSPTAPYNLYTPYISHQLSIHEFIQPSTRARIQLTGRNPCTWLSRRHCALDTVCSYPRLLDMGQSTRCMLCYVPTGQPCMRLVCVAVVREAYLSNLVAAGPDHSSGLSSSFLLLIVKRLRRR